MLMLKDYWLTNDQLLITSNTSKLNKKDSKSNDTYHTIK